MNTVGCSNRTDLYDRFLLLTDLTVLTVTVTSSVCYKTTAKQRAVSGFEHIAAISTHFMFRTHSNGLCKF